MITASDPIGIGELNDLGSLIGHNWMPFLTFVVVACMLIARLVEAHEGLQKILGPLGRRLGDAYRKRQERYRVDLAQEAKLLAVELLPKVVPADYDAVKNQLHNIITRVEDLELENNALRGFIIYDEEWHFAMRLSFAKLGIDLPAGMAEHLAWDVFVEKWKSGWRPKTLLR
jgi:hypothetical protein